MKAEKNVPLTRDEVRSITPMFGAKTDEKGRTIRTTMIAYENKFPNRQQRRADKYASATGNRKTTAGRRYQIVPIQATKETKFGPVKVATGYMRRIMHRIVETRIMKSLAARNATIFGKRHKLKNRL